MLEPDNIILASRFNHFPGSLEAGSEDHTVACLEVKDLASILADDRISRQYMKIFPLVIGNAPLAGRRLPYAGIKPVSVLVEVPAPELRRSRQQPVGSRRSRFRLCPL